MGQMMIDTPLGCFLVPGGEISAAAPAPMPVQVERFEQAVLTQYEPAEMPLRHLFSEGIYARVINIPAGVMATGRVHRYRALNVLLAGEIAEMTAAGPVIHAAPKVWVGDPGAKRLLYALTDTIWMTVHATAETDPDELKDQLTAASYAEFLAAQEVTA